MLVRKDVFDLIREKDRVFSLRTKETSYIFRVLPSGHLENLHYGRRLREQDYRALYTKRNAAVGGMVAYNPKDDLLYLDLIPLEYSFNGKGDYRIMPLEAEMPDGTYVGDFVYREHRIVKGSVPMDTLPGARGSEAECETLEVVLKDRVFAVELRLFYTVFQDCDVITRRAVLENRSGKDITIRKFMSMNLDIPGGGYEVLTLDGGWIRETHAHMRELSYGTLVNESTTGTSSSRHNPGVILAKKGTLEDSGVCYGFNLVYSGNHHTAVERSTHDNIRVISGISPHNFNWILKDGETFETPEAVMTFSGRGLNTLSHHFHDFVNHHIVPGPFKGKDRPVLMNNWEATFFDFNEKKLISLAKEASKLGVELFVLDDGWFGRRDDDTRGLGDYTVNRRKLPRGLGGLSSKIRAMGMEFGLWVEPEMVNPNSELFRDHPEYAVKIAGRVPSYGRNQLVLDLCQEDVRDYIVRNVNEVLEESGASYIKWDMNRNLTDMHSESVPHQGMFFHSYVLGLYDILRQVTEENPHVLFESCSSGGNRFDLGMLSFMPQTWASDDTDPVERLKIQEGLSYFYPQSSIGAHVSASPHQQTLRTTPLETRFNVAAFGLLGYELDLDVLDAGEKEEIRSQIAWYKANRQLMQYGRFYRFDREKANRTIFQVTGPEGKESVIGNFQTLAEASPSPDVLSFKGLNPDWRYRVTTRRQTMDIGEFGNLLKHVIPVSFRSDGPILSFARRHYRLPNNVEDYTAYGDLLESGIRLNQQYMGTGYGKELRILKDFGSQLMEARMIEGRENHGE
jgi:alpha-galactosidase